LKSYIDMNKIYEELEITFRVAENNRYKSCIASYNGSLNRNRFIAILLNMYDITLCKSIILAIDNAEKTSSFNDFHGPDSLDDGDYIKIVPPNVLIADGDWKIDMKDWKRLMEEWVSFQQANL